MKILHLSHTDLAGGAFTASYRLHSALIEKKINSQMLVRIKNTKDVRVIKENSLIEKIKSKITIFIELGLALLSYPKKNTTYTLNILPSTLLSTIKSLSPDLIHIHWVGGEFLPLELLKKISIPIVWTFHDLWPILGTEHYKEDVSANRIIKMINIYQLRRKKNILVSLNNFSIIAPSNWLKKQIEGSFLRSINNIYIPNCIDERVFSPLSKNSAKKKLNIDVTKKLILFGASNILDKRKGYAEFQNAMQILSENSGDTKNINIGAFGHILDKKIKNSKNYIHFGFITNSKKMSLLLSAADVCVFPSLIDNLPSTVLESLSCGTPVVAFNIGGISDLIEHKKNGYLAKPHDVTDLAEGIKWILQSKSSNYEKMCITAREHILKKFSKDVITKKHIQLYKKLLKE